MLEIIDAYDEKGLATVIKLFQEYASSLGIRLDFQNFDEELAALPGDYRPPAGRLLLAQWTGEPAGCVALRRIEGPICEMKRLYTRPKFRRLGIGRALCEAVMQEARRIGYQRMRLDTLPSMEAAKAMYLSFGFREIAPYCYNPVEGAMFLELEL
jgi:ribosomal protein S18 acetylase RimI-like enzyme